MNDATRADRADTLPEHPGKTAVRRWLRPLLAIPTPVIFVIAAVAAAAVMWRQGSLGDIASSIRDVSPWAVTAVLLAYSGSILVLGLRWHILAQMAGGAPPWAASVEVFLTSVIVNYAAPIGLAVPTRAALTVRDLGLSARQSAAVVAWELGMDVAALAIISAAWLLLGGGALLQTVAVDPRLIILLGMILVALVLAVVTFTRRTSPGRKVLAAVQHDIVQLVNSPALAALALLTTALFWGVQTGIMAALLRIFGTPPSTPLLLGVMGLPILIGMLSPVPGGAGIREGLMAAAARLESVPAGPVVLAAIAYRLALFVVTPLVWVLVRLARSRIGRG